MRYVVRFLTDCGAYAAKEEAAWEEEIAMRLQQKGFAMVVGPADEVAAPKPKAGPGIASMLDNTNKELPSARV